MRAVRQISRINRSSRLDLTRFKDRQTCRIPAKEYTVSRFEYCVIQAR